MVLNLIRGALNTPFHPPGMDPEKRSGGATIFLQHKYSYNKILCLTKNIVIIVGIDNQCDQ